MIYGEKKIVIVHFKVFIGISLVQWLRLGAFTAVTRGAPLAGELRSCEPQDIAKNKQTKKTLCKTLGEPVSFLESS